MYFDPLTGKKVAKSAGTRDRRQAERSADVADELWATYGNNHESGNTFGNIGPKQAEMEVAGVDVKDYQKRG